MNPDETGLPSGHGSFTQGPGPACLELARLQWLLVVEGRRAWTTLSTAVLAGVGLALQSRAPAGLTSPLGLVLALTALTCCLLWLHVQRRMRQVERQIRLQAPDAGLQPAYSPVDFSMNPAALISALSSSPSAEAVAAVELPTGSRRPLPWPPLNAWLPPERAPRA